MLFIEAFCVSLAMHYTIRVTRGRTDYYENKINLQDESVLKSQTGRACRTDLFRVPRGLWFFHGLPPPQEVRPEVRCQKSFPRRVRSAPARCRGAARPGRGSPTRRHSFRCRKESWPPGRRGPRSTPEKDVKLAAALARTYSGSLFFYLKV